jgi:tetratricopeptide (TPR) repeat protein
MRPASAVSKLEGFKMSRFWRYFIWIALGSNLVWYLFGFTWPYYWTLLACLLGPVAVCLITSRSAGDVANCLCGSGHQDTFLQDRLAGEIDKIRFLKRQGKFEKALAVVNDVLDQAPNFPEALYLKAHVLWEGYKNPWAAESYFKKVIELTEDREPIHRWASSCLLSPRINGRS